MENIFDNRKHPFTVPENHFERLEDHIILRKNAQKSFRTPDFYFDKLEDKILSRTINNKNRGKIISLFYNVKYWAVAACIALFLFAGSFWFHNNNSYNQQSYAANGQKTVVSPASNKILLASKTPNVNNTQTSAPNNTVSDFPQRTASKKEGGAWAYSSQKTDKNNVNTASTTTVSTQAFDDRSTSSEVIYNAYFAPEDEDYSDDYILFL